MNATTMNPPTTHRTFRIGIVLVVALGALVWAGSVSLFATKLVHEPVNQALGTAARANVEIALAIGELHISALEQSGELIDGEISHSDRNQVVRAFASRDDTAAFTLREQDSKSNTLINFNTATPTWNLRLAPATPLHLTFETGVGASTIDLSRLNVTDLTLNTGVGSVNMTLPSQGRVQARVSGGVGTTTILVPAGMAMRLEAETGLGGVEVPQTYQRQGNVYTSPGFDTATSRVELKAESGIGAITIKQAGE